MGSIAPVKINQAQIKYFNTVSVTLITHVNQYSNVHEIVANCSIDLIWHLVKYYKYSSLVKPINELYENKPLIID